MLQCKRILLSSVFLGSVISTTCAQTGQDSLWPSKHIERINFGFCFGGSNFLLGLKEADIYHAALGYQDSIKNISARGSLGLMMGIVVEARFGKGFYLKLNPGILFNNYVVYYDRMNGRTDLMSSQNSFIELPVHLAYKWENNKKLVPVMTAGSSFRFDYTRPQNEFARTKFWSVDIAIALEKKIGRITVIPEIRYAHALSDVWINRRMEIPRLIDRVRLNTIYFIIGFRG